MISYDMDPYYHTLLDTKTGEKPFDVRTLTLRSFLSMVLTSQRNCKPLPHDDNIKNNEDEEAVVSDEDD